MSRPKKSDQSKLKVIRRRVIREVALYVDGVALDRAARREGKRLDFNKLREGLTNGTSPKVAKYYTVIPREDDSRQRAFLDAISRAGFEIVLKRLPPIGINRQVTTDVEMATDLIHFALGAPSKTVSDTQDLAIIPAILPADAPEPESGDVAKGDIPIVKAVTVVCPGRDLNYPIALARQLGVDTTTADFGRTQSGDIMKSAAKWIDLSGSELIWMAEAS